jgi:hypothetical protein
MSYLFSFIRKLPEEFQVPAITRLHLFFGAWKETWIEENGQWVKKSLTTHEFWNTGMIYLPSFMCHQVHTGIVRKSTIPSFASPKIYQLNLSSPIEEDLSEIPQYSEENVFAKL